MLPGAPRIWRVLKYCVEIFASTLTKFWAFFNASNGPNPLESTLLCFWLIWKRKYASRPNRADFMTICYSRDFGGKIGLISVLTKIPNSKGLRKTANYKILLLSKFLIFFFFFILVFNKVTFSSRNQLSYITLYLCLGDYLDKNPNLCWKLLKRTIFME